MNFYESNLAAEKTLKPVYGFSIVAADIYQSVYSPGTALEKRHNATKKCAIQTVLWNKLKGDINTDINAGMDKQSLRSKYYWLETIGDRAPISDLESYAADVVNDWGVEENEDKQYKFMTKTARWLSYISMKYIAENALSRRAQKGPHVSDAKLFNCVIDGVVWNPVMFRRYLPFQFLNKLSFIMRKVPGVYHPDDMFDTKGRVMYVGFPDIDMSVLDFMNSTYSVRRRFDGVVASTSNKYVTPDEVRAKGYAAEADLIESFGEYQIVKTAILYYEREVLINQYFKGNLVGGEMKFIEKYVSDMSRDDIESYLARLAQRNFEGHKLAWFDESYWRDMQSGI